MNACRLSAPLLLLIAVIAWTIGCETMPTVSPSRLEALRLIDLGADQAMAGDFSAAIATLDSAIIVDPEVHFARYYRGLARAGSGDVEGAAQDYEAELRLASDPDVKLRIRRAEAQLRVRRSVPR